MKKQRFVSARQALAGVAMSFALAAPAFAGHWHGGPMAGPGHAGCTCLGPAHPHGMPGYHEACPYHHSQAMKAAREGKSIGVMIRDLGNKALDKAGLGYGVKVVDVLPDSAGAAAGLRVDDLIVEFGGKPVTSADRLRWLVRQAEAGKPIDIKVLRDQASVTLSATLTEPAAKEKCVKPEEPKPGV